MQASEKESKRRKICPRAPPPPSTSCVMNWPRTERGPLQLEPGDKLPEQWQGPVVLLRFVLLYLFYCVNRFIIIQLQILFMLNMFFCFHFNVIVYMAVCLVCYYLIL
jgi:hypothetical protein